MTNIALEAMAQSKVRECSHLKWWIFPLRYVSLYQRVDAKHGANKHQIMVYIKYSVPK